MKISENELYSAALKACIGAEFPRGVGEDLARAAVALAQCDVDPLAMLVRTVELPSSEHLQWLFQTPNWVCRNGFVSTVGPSLVDFSQLVEGSGYATAIGVENCGLVYGCALAVSRAAQVSFKIKFDEYDKSMFGEWVLVGDETIDSVPTEKSNVSLRCLGDANSPTTPKSSKGLNVDEGDWEALKKLAERVLVPANDENRADAGAGNTDND